MICTSYDSEAPFMPWRFANEADDFLRKKLPIPCLRIVRMDQGIKSDRSICA